MTTPINEALEALEVADNPLFIKQELLLSALETLATEVRRLTAELAARDKRIAELSDDLGVALVYAARYAHNRSTGAALHVVIKAKSNWDDIAEQHRMQLIKESHEATTNAEDWQSLRDNAKGAQARDEHD